MKKKLMNTTNILYKDFRDTNHQTIAKILKKADLSFLPDVLLYHLCIERVMWMEEYPKSEKINLDCFMIQFTEAFGLTINV